MKSLMLLCVLYHSCYKHYCLCGSSSYKTERRLERSQDKSRMLAILVSLGLLRCLVEGNSQTFPYVSFMGQTLANHSYVDLSLVGYLTTDSVQCHTDLTTCCAGGQGIHRGDWYFPNGDRLQFDSTYNDIHQDRNEKRVDLRRKSFTSPTGIYRCDIATIDVHHTEPNQKAVYVGLYANGRGLS